MSNYTRLGRKRDQHPDEENIHHIRFATAHTKDETCSANKLSKLNVHGLCHENTGMKVTTLCIVLQARC